MSAEPLMNRHAAALFLTYLRKHVEQTYATPGGVFEVDAELPLDRSNRPFARGASIHCSILLQIFVNVDKARERMEAICAQRRGFRLGLTKASARLALSILRNEHPGMRYNVTNRVAVRARFSADTAGSLHVKMHSIGLEQTERTTAGACPEFPYQITREAAERTTKEVIGVLNTLVSSEGITHAYGVTFTSLIRSLAGQGAPALAVSGLGRHVLMQWADRLAQAPQP